MRYEKTLVSALRYLCAAALLAGLAPAAWAQSFNDPQKQEIGKIVREYLLQNPEVLREAFAELERRETAAKEEQARKGIAENADMLYKSKLSFVAGNPEGKVSMVEFFDYNCGYCKRAFGDVMSIVKDDTDLKLVLKEFPILGPGSVFASRAAIASKKQGKYWDFHISMMEARGALEEASVIKIAEKVGLDIDKLRKDMEAPEVAAEIEEAYALASKLGINGTPAFIIDDKLIPGALGLQALQQQVASVREAGGCKVC